MTEATPSAEALRRSLAALKDMRERLARVERAAHRADRHHRRWLPVPGGRRDSPDAFWRLLRDGVDAVDPSPAGTVGHRGLLLDPDAGTPGSDLHGPGRLPRPDRSRIRRRLLRHLAAGGGEHGPQQRLLLEVAWEALEDAGVAPDGSPGRRPASSSASGTVRLRQPAACAAIGLAESDAYSGTGDRPQRGGRPPLVPARAAGPSAGRRHRLLLVARGRRTSPCQALRSGRVRLALAGGVNLMLDARATIMPLRSARAVARRALQDVRRRAPTATSAARAAASSCSSGSPTPWPTATGSSP